MPTVTVRKGDITRVEADAIVNAANTALWMGDGVAGAIKRRGGQVIEDEAIKQAPIPVGEAVVTCAGTLHAQYVIHAAAMATDLVTDSAQIGGATKNCLLRAEELGLKSLAFPALGTGVGGFSCEKAAEIMLGVVREHLAGESGLDEVLFVLYDDEGLGVFEERLAELEHTEGGSG